MEPKYIIIAGTSKSATTSVFNYLAKHPNVCASNIKQTNYFLSKETQIEIDSFSTHEYTKEGMGFEKFFNCKNEEYFRLEATPDYINYYETSQRLKLFSKNNNTTLVFILRDPVTRFLSWYNFGKQQGDIPEDMSLDDFYKASKEYKEDKNVSMMAYRTGYYSKYLKHYFENSKTNKIEIFFYENLIQSTSNFITDFCDRLGIDKSFYNSFNFQHYNKTITTKSKTLNTIYNRLRSFYIKNLFKGYIGVRLGGLLKGTLGNLYRKLNTKKLSKNSINNVTLLKLKEDYKQDIKALKYLIKIKDLPWT